MNSLIIKNLEYFGENYHYKSPDFNKGMNVLIGENKTGKSTFSDLLYYGLGGDVPQFNSNSKSFTDKHLEIVSDKSNYVVVKIILNNLNYTLMRKINSSERNVIYVTSDETLETKHLYVNRSVKASEGFTFSDWILGELGVKKLEIQQGSKSFILNFKDLMRLIYHNQLSDSSFVMKQPDGQRNFINDSTEIRNIIFESLTSDVAIDYYQSINDYKQADREHSNQVKLVKSIFKQGIKIGVNYDKKSECIRSYNDIEEECKGIELKINSIENAINENDSLEVTAMKNEIRDAQYNYERLHRRYKLLNEKLIDFRSLTKIQEGEIEKIKLAIVASKYMSLNEDSLCPICKNHVTRVPGKCVCGSDVSEKLINSLYVTNKERDDILTRKKVALQSTHKAIYDIRDELTLLDEQMKIRNDIISQKRDTLRDMLQLVNEQENVQVLANLTLRLNRLNKKLAKYEYTLGLFDEYEQQLKDLRQMNDLKEEKRLIMNRKEVAHRQSMVNIISDFSDIYEKLYKEYDSSILTAHIDNLYRPIINNGIYSNMASLVPRRLFYYLSILLYSLNDDKVPFPKFLLIDTPKNFGIDEVAMIKLSKYMDEIFEAYHDYQIILTIGKEYGNCFQNAVVLSEIDNKLLEKN